MTERGSVRIGQRVVTLEDVQAVAEALLAEADCRCSGATPEGAHARRVVEEMVRRLRDRAEGRARAVARWRP